MNWKKLLIPVLIVLVDVVQEALSDWLNDETKNLPDA